MLKATKQLLFQRNTKSHYGFFDAIKFDISKRVLTRLHKQHIKAGFKQIAVFSFDTIALDIAYFGVYEKKELDCFFAWLAFVAEDFNHAAALDIGANIGNHSLYFSDHFKTVFAFEPNPRTYGLLRFNAGLVNNIQTFNFGLSNIEGEAELHTEAKNIGASRITSTQSTSQETQTKQSIQLKVLDQLAISDLPIKLIKIDVEGHEFEALTGAKELIIQQQPIVLFEQLKQEFVDGTTPTINLLKSYGYAHFAIAEFGPKASKYWPKFMRKFIQKIMVLLIGKQATIQLTPSFETKSYPFIIAIPGWLASQLEIDSNKQ